MRLPRSAWFLVSAITAAICYAIHSALKVEGGDSNDLRSLASTYFLFATITFTIAVIVIGSLRHSKSKLAPLIPAMVMTTALLFTAAIVLALRLLISTAG